MTGYQFNFTGDPAFDFFFSLIATGSIILYLVTLPLSLLRGYL